MEENLKNKLGFWIFIIIVLFLAIGGYFFMDYVLKEPEEKNNDLKEKINHKIDKNKDFIYFENAETISEGAEIYYQDVVINLDTQEVLTESLRKENKIYKENIQYISKQSLMNEELITYNNDDLYSLNFREYKTYEFDKYVSLLIIDQYYTCFDLNTFYKTKSYIFNTETGALLTEEEILSLYDLEMAEIKNKIKTHLESKQVIDNEVEVIRIEDTINDFKNYAFYINEYGRLYISYLVKSTQVDYNEIMEVN